jgi:hypothetical protein
MNLLITARHSSKLVCDSCTVLWGADLLQELIFWPYTDLRFVRIILFENYVNYKYKLFSLPHNKLKNTKWQVIFFATFSLSKDINKIKINKQHIFEN